MRLPIGRPDADEQPASDPAVDTPRIDDAETRMRQALGLGGGHGGREIVPQEGRANGRHGQSVLSLNARKRRFVRDGDVPVTILSGRGHHTAETQEMGGSAAAPVNRLELAERALAGERSAREQAERAQHDALASLRDLQTKLGHAELSHRETLKAGEALREALRACESRLQQAEEEGRHLAAALSIAQEGRAAAEAALQQSLAGQPPRDPLPGSAVRAKAPATSGLTRTAARAQPKTREPQPVKWWTERPAAKSKTRAVTASKR